MDDRPRRSGDYTVSVNRDGFRPDGYVGPGMDNLFRALASGRMGGTAHYHLNDAGIGVRHCALLHDREPVISMGARVRFDWADSTSFGWVMGISWDREDRAYIVSIKREEWGPDGTGQDSDPADEHQCDELCPGPRP